MFYLNMKKSGVRNADSQETVPETVSPVFPPGWRPSYSVRDLQIACTEKSRQCHNISDFIWCYNTSPK